MVLHVGGPVLPPGDPPPKPLPIARAIERAAAEVDLSTLETARRFRGGSVLIAMKGPSGTASYVVSGDRVAPIAPGLVRVLHEGTWARAWSGALNLVSALALTGLMTTGTVSWMRR